MHRDLKPGNILIKFDPQTRNMIVSLCLQGCGPSMSAGVWSQHVYRGVVPACLQGCGPSMSAGGVPLVMYNISMEK